MLCYYRFWWGSSCCSFSSCDMGQHNHNYNLMGFDTIEINLVILQLGLLNSNFLYQFIHLQPEIDCNHQAPCATLINFSKLSGFSPLCPFLVSQKPYCDSSYQYNDSPFLDKHLHAVYHIFLLLLQASQQHTCQPLIGPDQSVEEGR